MIHPELYWAGREALLALISSPNEVSDTEVAFEILKHWGSPFTGLSVIQNRETPVHRDVQGRHPWMDILTTVGPYTNGRMELRSLGYRLKYESGTMVGICGKAVPHAMRDKVHERLGIAAPSWMTLK